MDRGALRHRLQQLWLLPPHEKRLLLRAWLWLPVLDLALRCVALPRLQGWLLRRARRQYSVDGAPISAANWHRLVGAAARRQPWPVRCLPRALCLQYLLAEAGVVGELVIGIRTAAAPITQGGLQAHAWVEIDGRPVAEPRSVGAEFRPLRPAARRCEDAVRRTSVDRLRAETQELISI